jgi:hypothetical protein
MYYSLLIRYNCLSPALIGKLHMLAIFSLAGVFQLVPILRKTTMALSENPTNQQLKDLAAQHADLEVTWRKQNPYVRMDEVV